MAFGGFSQGETRAPQSDINMVPLIDVMLVLLIVFMITAPLLTHSVKIDLPKFTLVGATTRAGLLTTPLRDRFGIPVRLQFYTVEELQGIVARGATRY